MRLDGDVLEGNGSFHIGQEHADDGIVGVHGCGEVACGRRLGGRHHRRPLHLLVLVLMLLRMLRRARCVLCRHMGGCRVVRGLVLVLVLVGGVDLVMQIVLPRRVGGLGGVLSHAVTGVSRCSLDSASLWYILGRGKWPANGSSSSPTAADGPECILARRRARVVHEEGAPVGDEGWVRVTLLLVLFVLPPPAVSQRLWPS